MASAGGQEMHAAAAMQHRRLQLNPRSLGLPRLGESTTGRIRSCAGCASTLRVQGMGTAVAARGVLRFWPKGAKEIRREAERRSHTNNSQWQ